MLYVHIYIYIYIYIYVSYILHFVDAYQSIHIHANMALWLIADMSESQYDKLGSWKTFIVHIVCIGTS